MKKVKIKHKQSGKIDTIDEIHLSALHIQNNWDVIVEKKADPPVKPKPKPKPKPKAKAKKKTKSKKTAKKK